MEQVEQKSELDLKNLSGGLELLVELAEKGDIDPWDVDIIEVTDKYLAALDKTPRENLLHAGRAIFFASVLLRLKSDILLNLSNETLISSQQVENFFPEDDLLLDQDEVRIDISKLENFIVRSSIGKQQRKRKLLLTDLIVALQQAEEEEDRRALRAKLRAERFTIADIDAPEDVLEIAHEEDIDDIVEKVEAIIQEHLTDEKPIALSFVAEILNNKAKPFLALLFLVHAQKIVIEQKEFYGEVYIYKAGTVLEEPITVEEQQEKPEKKKKKSKSKKKGIVQKIKEVFSKDSELRAQDSEEEATQQEENTQHSNKTIEITSCEGEVVDISTKEKTNEPENPESEVNDNG